MKLNLGPYHVVALFPKTSAEKSTVHWLKKKDHQTLQRLISKTTFLVRNGQKRLGMVKCVQHSKLMKKT